MSHVDADNGGGDKASFDFPKFTLPDGTVIALADLTYTSLRSAFIIQPWTDDARWNLFTYSRSQAIVGVDRVATRSHTNIPRTGESGLPRGWAALIYRWRANLNVPLEQPVLDWANETSVTFEYNQKNYGSEVLADLLFGTQPLGVEPVHLRECLSYTVTVETSDRRVLENLRTWLRGPAVADNVRETIFELDAVARFVPGPTADSIRRVQAKLQPGRSLTGWIHLEGPLKRCII